MVSYSASMGHSPLKPTALDQFSSGVKAESSSPNQGVIGSAIAGVNKTEWQKYCTDLQGQPASLARVSSPQHRHPGVPGQPSLKLEHQLYGEKERDAGYEEFPHDRKRSRIRDAVHTVSSQVGTHHGGPGLTQSQLLFPRGLSGSSGPALTRDTSVPTPKYSEPPHHSSDRSISPVASSPRLASAVSLNPLDEPSPLGLTLRKTPSLLHLISMKLAQGSGVDQGSTAAAADTLAQDSSKNRAKCLVPTVAAQDKLKASNFPASSLKVGTWERVSRYEGDLVGKCYYAKRKLVWEVLESGLKSKIEIQWSDISAMKASCPDNLPGTLEIEVSRPPLFFRETNPQPRKHTLWQATSDFTGGQATICKRHSLQFPEGVLNRHYEKLVQCDPRLKALVEGTLSMRPTPEFEHASWLHQHLPSHQLIGQQTGPYDVNKDQQSYIFSPLRGLNTLGTHPGRISDCKPEGRLMKMHSHDLASPSSVMDDPRGSDESGTSDTEDLRPHDDVSEYEGLDLMYPNSRNDEGHGLPDVKPSCNNHFTTGEGVLLPDRKRLDEIAQVLLGESASSLSNEQAMMVAAKVGPMSAALAEEFQLPGHALAGLSEDNSHLQLFNVFQVKSEMVHGDDQIDSMITSPGSMSVSGRLSQRDLSFNSLMACHGTAGDLLLNLPRVASLPQLFETTSQVSVGRYDPAFTRSSYMGADKLR